MPEPLSHGSRILRWETLEDSGLGGGRGTTFPHRVPVTRRVLSVSLCKTLRLFAVDCPPACQVPDASVWGSPALLVFLLGICRFSPCSHSPSSPASAAMHISVVWMFWQLKGLGMILNFAFSWGSESLQALRVVSLRCPYSCHFYLACSSEAPSQSDPRAGIRS